MVLFALIGWLSSAEVRQSGSAIPQEDQSGESSRKPKHGLSEVRESDRTEGHQARELG